MVLNGWDKKDIAAATKLLASEQARLRLRAPWSLAELRLDDDDFDALVSWFRNLRTDQFFLHVASGGKLVQFEDGAMATREEGLGLLLLAVFSEYARRNASPGKLWPFIEALAGEGMKRALFTEQPQPRAEVTAALAAAARRFRLRHALDEHDARRWVRTVMLQVGFLDSAPDVVGMWLNGTRPYHVALKELATGVFPARSVELAIDALGKLRRRAMSPDAARQKLENCPFVRNASIDKFLEGATSSKAPALGSAPDEVDDDSIPVESLQVRWRAGGVPEAVLRFGPIGTLGPLKTKVMVDGVRRAWLYASADGTLAPAGADRLELTLPVSETYRVSLEAIDSDARADTLVEVLGDEAAAFFTDDGATTAGARAVILVTRGRITRTPDLLGTVHVANGVSVVRLGDAVTVVGADDGEVLWPRGGEVSETIDVQVLETRLEGELVQVDVRTPANATLREAHVGGVAWRVSSMGQGRFTVEGMVPPWSARGSVSLTLGLDAGGRLVQRTVALWPFTRLADQQSWIASDATISSATYGSLHCALGPESRDRDAHLVAGARVRRLGKMGRMDLDALCLGEALELVAGSPVSPDAIRRPLAGSLVHHGIVTALRTTDRSLELDFTDEVELSEDHWLCVWPTVGPAVSADITKSGERSVRASWSGGAVRAVAVAYKSAWLGATWTSGWSRGLGDMAAADAWQLLRALRLPILTRDSNEDLVELTRRDPAAASFSGGCTRAPFHIDVGKRRLEGQPRDRWREAVESLMISARIEQPAHADSLRDRVASVADNPPSNAWFELFSDVLVSASALHPHDACASRRLAVDRNGWGNQMRCRYRGFANLSDPSVAGQRGASLTRLLRRSDEDRIVGFSRRTGVQFESLMDAVLSVAEAPNASGMRGALSPHIRQALLDAEFRRVAAARLLDTIVTA